MADYSDLVKQFSNKPITKDNPLFVAVKNKIDKLGLASVISASYENGDNYCRLWRVIESKKYADDIISHFDTSLRTEINRMIGYPIMTKAFYLPSSDDDNPFTKDVVGVFLLPFERAKLCEINGGGHLHRSALNSFLDAGGVYRYNDEKGNVFEVTRKI